ncbi:MAG TPA: hypothetical protein VII01_18155 [Solirubrobacteraceae bacterium]
MLAYIFWHQPSAAEQAAEYEDALVGFHRSLARSLPVGTRASAVFRVASLPWPISHAYGEEAGGDGAGPSYEDWYLLEDYAALGVLNKAAVGRGHRTSHDEAARRFGGGAGALYGLIEGEPCAAALGEAAKAIWIARPAGAPRRGLSEMLGDGMEPSRASLWRRQLVLGPAPEFCLLADEVPAGVGPDRLPAGWTATMLEREVLWSG